MTTISVVIPVYNRENSIRRALDSVLAQSLPPYEIIVVDDGSTDRTADIIAEHYPTVTLIRQPNRGQCTARNEGIARAGGDLIALLDSDDFWLPDKLRVQARVFEEHPQLGLVATQKYKNRAQFPVCKAKTPRIRYYPFSVFLKRTWLHPSSVVIPKWVLKEIGCFDKSLGAAEDWDLWARIAYRYPVVRIKQRLTAVFEVSDSMSRNRSRQYMNDIKVIAKWNPANPNTADQDRRIHPNEYRHRVFNFAFLRGVRLYRYGGSRATLEFLERLDEQIPWSGPSRTCLHLFFKWVHFTLRYSPEKH